MKQLIIMPTKEPYLSDTERAVGVGFQSLLKVMGVCPTQEQIAVAVGVDRTVVCRAMARLVALGYYTKEKGRNRSYSIVRAVSKRKTTAA